jgi:hypothetical protein
MPDKLELTKRLAAQSDLWTVTEAMKEWWQNPNGGWRLTHVGFDAFKQCKLEHWDYETSTAIQARARVLLALDRKLTSPYYIKLGKKPMLCFFDHREATMYAMYGDLEKFLRYLERL